MVERLVDAGEALFGLHGVEGVSLRQVSAAAGTGNNYAVQYHFGDVEGLVLGILARRMPVIEARRAERLAKARDGGRIETRALMDILYRPLIDHVDARGERAYARFVLALQHWSPRSQTMETIGQAMPAAVEVLQLLAAANPDVPLALLLERQRLAAIMVLTSLVARRKPWNGDAADAAMIDNVLDMASAAISAPISPSTRELVQHINATHGERQ